MKIIKIENCFNCPLSSHISTYDEIVCICESGANINNIGDTIELNDPIPKWCPLSDTE